MTSSPQGLGSPGNDLPQRNYVGDRNDAGNQE